MAGHDGHGVRDAVLRCENGVELSFENEKTVVTTVNVLDAVEDGALVKPCLSAVPTFRRIEIFRTGFFRLLREGPVGEADDISNAVEDRHSDALAVEAEMPLLDVSIVEAARVEVQAHKRCHLHLPFHHVAPVFLINAGEFRALHRYAIELCNLLQRFWKAQQLLVAMEREPPHECNVVRAEVRVVRVGDAILLVDVFSSDMTPLATPALDARRIPVLVHPERRRTVLMIRIRTMADPVPGTCRRFLQHHQRVAESSYAAALDLFNKFS